MKKKLEQTSQKDAGLTEGHVGQIERGEILVSLTALDKIIYATGADAHYVLYGIRDNNKISMTRRNINTLLDLCTSVELTYFLKCLSAFKNLKSKK